MNGRMQQYSARPGVPLAAECTAKKTMSIGVSLFDHLVGAADQRQRNGEAERLGSLQVDDQLDFGGLLDRQVGRLLAFEIWPV